MDYCIVQDGTIANMIIFENEEIAEEFGAVPSYEGARIGDSYDPPPAPPDPPTPPTVEELQRELAETRARVDAASRSTAMLEDCVAEMAEIVYA